MGAKKTNLLDRSSGFLHYFNIGHFVMSKAQWLYAVVIILKLWNAPLWMYLVSLPVILLLTIIIGFIFDITGLWREYMRKQYKGVLR